MDFKKIFEVIALKLSKSCLYIYSPFKGEVRPLESCSDIAFSEKSVGDGVLVIPEDGTMVAPFDAKVASIFHTKHAVAFVSKNGIKVLVHMGIDTNSLQGEPFEFYVKEGDKVKKGEKICKVNLEMILEKGCLIETPVIVINDTDLVFEKMGQVEYEKIILAKLKKGK